jgi:plasmid replication initiation protein
LGTPICLKNSLLDLNLGVFTAAQIDILMLFCASHCSKEWAESSLLIQKISFKDIRRITGLISSVTKKSELINILNDFGEKCTHQPATNNVSTKKETFDIQLFKMLEADIKTKTVVYQISREFEAILTYGKREYTNILYEDLLELRSVYSKIIFLYMKRWRSAGKWQCDADRFLRQLNLAPTYEKRRIKEKCLAVAKKELSQVECFSDITILINPQKKTIHNKIVVVGISFKDKSYHKKKKSKENESKENKSKEKPQTKDRQDLYEDLNALTRDIGKDIK